MVSSPLRCRSSTPTRSAARQQFLQQQEQFQQLERRRRQDSLIRSALQRPVSPRGRRWLGSPPPSPRPRPQPPIRQQQKLLESARCASRRLDENWSNRTRHTQQAVARYQLQREEEEDQERREYYRSWDEECEEDPVDRAHRRWKSTERQYIDRGDGRLPYQATRRYEVVWDRPWISYGFRRVWN